jgi:hypothetical protein
MNKQGQTVSWQPRNSITTAWQQHGKGGNEKSTGTDINAIFCQMHFFFDFINLQ